MSPQHIPFRDTVGATRLLDQAVISNIPALIVGETGVGKTTCLRELAREKGRELVRVSVNGATGVEEIVGKWLLKDGQTIWVNGVLTEAMTQGYWIVFDEINAALPEILFTLHAVLDDDRKLLIPEKDGTIVRPHDDFRFFATMNPCSSYAGTKEMNTALLSRFGVVIQMPHLSPKDEQELIQTFGGVTPEAAGLLTHAGIQLREAWRKEDVAFFCSTRDLLQAAQLHALGIPLEEAATVALVNKGQTMEDRNALRDALQGVFQMQKEGRRVSYTMDEQVYQALYEARKDAIEARAGLNLAVLDMKTLEQKAEMLTKQRDVLLQLLKDFLRPYIENIRDYCQEQSKDGSKTKKERGEWKKLAERADEKLQDMDQAAKTVQELSEQIQKLEQWKQEMAQNFRAETQRQLQRLEEDRKQGFGFSTSPTEEPQKKGYTIISVSATTT